MQPHVSFNDEMINAGVRAFADRAYACVAEYVSQTSGNVAYRGSFATGNFDQWSDVDLTATVAAPLTVQFFENLEAGIRGEFGASLVRYDPDFQGNRKAQGVRFSFYRLPVFWRIDLIVESTVDATENWPAMVESWSLGNSALMNAVWAIKCHRRKNGLAAEYLNAACKKLNLAPVEDSLRGVEAILNALGSRNDVDGQLLANTLHALAELCN